MSTDVTLESFLKQKLINFISYLEKNIGINNKLYIQVKQLENNIRMLIGYAEQLVKISTNEEGKWKINKTTIIDYLKNNDINDCETLDDGNFVDKLKRYLELFVNMIC